MSKFGDMVYAMGGVPCIGGGEIPVSTGTYFFVDSATGNAGNTGRSMKSPLATIDQAINKCTANKGDVIVVMPNHTEDLDAAGDIDADIAGITIVGLGNGSNRPTITFSATAADIDIDAADITISNIVLDMGTAIDAVVQGIDVNAANFTLKNCLVQMSSSSYQAVSCVVTDANADNTKILDCEFLAQDAGAEEAIKIVGALTSIEIARCRINGDFSVAPIHNPTGNVATDVFIHDCVLKNDNAGEFALELVSACTGWLARNFYHTDALATAVDPGSCYSYECFTCHQVDRNGVLTPAVDS